MCVCARARACVGANHAKVHVQMQITKIKLRVNGMQRECYKIAIVRASHRVSRQCYTYQTMCKQARIHARALGAKRFAGWPPRTSFIPPHSVFNTPCHFAIPPRATAPSTLCATQSASAVAIPRA